MLRAIRLKRRTARRKTTHGTRGAITTTTLLVHQQRCGHIKSLRDFSCFYFFIFSISYLVLVLHVVFHQIIIPAFLFNFFYTHKLCISLHLGCRSVWSQTLLLNQPWMMLRVSLLLFSSYHSKRVYSSEIAKRWFLVGIVHQDNFFLFLLLLLIL